MRKRHSVLDMSWLAQRALGRYFRRKEGSTLIVTSGGSRTEQQLPSDRAVLAAYRDHFGIILDRVPAAAVLDAGP
jgi:hypothetical protein